jgi:transcription elongation factor
MKRGVIDRFEGDIVVIETEGRTIDVPMGRLPQKAKAGDVVIIDGDKFRLDRAETKKRKAEIDVLMDELFE